MEKTVTLDLQSFDNMRKKAELYDKFAKDNIPAIQITYYSGTSPLDVGMFSFNYESQIFSTEDVNVNRSISEYISERLKEVQPTIILNNSERNKIKSYKEDSIKLRNIPNWIIKLFN